MRADQLLRQLRHHVKTITDIDGNTMFGEDGVQVTPDIPFDQLSRWQRQMLFLSAERFTPHRQQPRVGSQLVSATIFIENVNDAFGGESAFELLKLRNKFLEQVGVMERDQGVEVVLVAESAQKPLKVPGNAPLLYQIYLLRARVGATADGDEYAPATGFTATDAGAGDAALSWTRPVGHASHYGYQGVTIRRDTSAVTSVTQGTEVQACTDNASLTDSPGAGTFHYGLFVCYDDDEDGTVESYSPVAQDSVTVT